MKRCPKCNFVFEDERRFCKKDGRELVAEAFILPSEVSETSEDEEERTVIGVKHFPSNRPPVSTTRPSINTYSRADPHLPKSSPSRLKGCLILSLVIVAGLSIVGIGAAGVVAIGYYLNRVSIKNPQTSDVPLPPPAKAGTPEMRDHNEKNREADLSLLNGHVIVRLAVVRSEPRKSSRPVAVLPLGDRLHIIRRRSPTSAWYRIECEHAAAGWMHGNLIAYVGE